MLTNGILILLKPNDMTSQQAVSAVKRMIGCKKAGHGGTLDPAAAGVLPVFLGSATRLAEYAAEGDKEYIAQIRFGSETDTQDAQGKITAQSDRIINFEQMHNLLSAFPKEYMQTPPSYSAIKIAGQKMADLARRGKTADIPPRPVRIFEKQLLGSIGRNSYLIRIRCSKGTYIRTICHDLGRISGAYAHCSFLLRTQSGPYELCEAVTFERLQKALQNGTFESLLLPMGSAVGHLQRWELDGDDVRRIAWGQALPVHEVANETGRVYALWHNDELIAIGSMDSDSMRPIKVLIGSERVAELSR